MLFLIATYQRPKKCLALLRQIKKQAPGSKIIVIDDASEANYLGVTSFLKANGDDYYRLKDHRGKKNYWEVNDLLFQYAKSCSSDYIFKLDDDIELHPRAISKAIYYFNIISNYSKKPVLNLYLDHRVDKMVWVNQLPKKVRLNGESFTRVGWIDAGNWLTSSNVFDLLDWRCPQPPDKWWDRPGDSSGVGKYLSSDLHRKAAGIYMSPEGLIYHGDHGSVMHPNKTNRKIEMKKKPWL